MQNALKEIRMDGIVTSLSQVVRETNIYVAWHSATGAIHYICATFDPKTNLYTRPLMAHEKRWGINKELPLTGSFADMLIVDVPHRARSMATRIFGDSSTSCAVYNLGKGYERAVYSHTRGCPLIPLSVFLTSERHNHLI